MAVAANLAAPDAPARLFTDVEGQLGPVDVLVTNAAHCESPDTIDALTADSLQRHFRINAIAPSLLTAEFARRAHGRQALCVVNISTDAARCFAGQLGYGTSEAALEAFTRAAALDSRSQESGSTPWHPAPYRPAGSATAPSATSAP